VQKVLPQLAVPEGRSNDPPNPTFPHKKKSFYPTAIPKGSSTWQATT